MSRSPWQHVSNEHQSIRAGLRHIMSAHAPAHARTTSPGTRANSRRLSVASAWPCASAVAATSMSCGPIIVPRFISSAHTSACRRASGSPKGNTGIVSSTASTNAPRRARTAASRARRQPWSSSEAVIAAIPTGSSPNDSKNRAKSPAPRSAAMRMEVSRITPTPHAWAEAPHVPPRRPPPGLAPLAA